MGARVAVAILALLVLGSAVAVVDAKHRSRKLFVELQGLNADRDRLEVEWGQLQLEQSTWGTDARIERVAHRQLDLKRPSSETVVIVKP